MGQKYPKRAKKTCVRNKASHGETKKPAKHGRKQQLKQRRAGRLTFLPLNKIRGGGRQGSDALQRGSSSGGSGCVGRAVELLRFDPAGMLGLLCGSILAPDEQVVCVSKLG